MLAPPPLKNFLRYPITAGIEIMAVVVTAMWWMGQPIDWLVMDSRVFAKWEVWRALTATLPHVDLMHLIFNLYWIWTFGAVVEREYGHLKCAGFYLLLAFGSSLAEFSLFYGGVGLSGVGYGLWGMLWVLGKRDVRFAQAVDNQTSRLFIFWFFLCIVLTLTNVMQVANVAHGVGAVMGVLLGLAVSGTDDLKWKGRAGIVAVLALGLFGATVFWPKVNLSAYAEAEVEHVGVNALEHHNDLDAIKWLEISTRMNHAPARAWYNLGIAYQHVGQYEDALTAYNHADSMPDTTPEISAAAQNMEHYLHPKKAYRFQVNEIATNTVPSITNR